MDPRAEVARQHEEYANTERERVQEDIEVMMRRHTRPMDPATTNFLPLVQPLNINSILARIPDKCRASIATFHILNAQQIQGAHHRRWLHTAAAVICEMVTQGHIPFIDDVHVSLYIP